MTHHTSKACKSVVSAVVTRADGTRVNLGMVSYWHRNPILRAVGSFFVFLKGVNRGFARSR